MHETIHLLLVDDHPFVRDGVRMRLEATEAIQVIGEAGSVDEAMQITSDLSAKGCPPDIVLTDISMRGMSGIQLATLFQNRFPTIDVLVLSMHDNPEYVKRAIESGAKGYVLKDAPAQQLVDAIHAVYAGNTFFSHELQQHTDISGAQGWNSPLTAKESATLAWLACGYSNKQIAQELQMSVRTVETHRLNLRRKLRIKGQAELVKYAIGQMLPLQNMQDKH